MDKTTAQQTLKQLQDSIAAATAQAKELQAIIDKPDVPKVFQGRFIDKTAADHDRTGRCFSVYSDGAIDSTATSTQERFDYGNLFKTKDDAIQAVRYNKLRQRARIALAKDWGNEPIVQDGRRERYAIVMYEGKVKINSYSSTILPILFRTQYAATTFLATLSTEDAILLTTGA